MDKIQLSSSPTGSTSASLLGTSVPTYLDEAVVHQQQPCVLVLNHRGDHGGGLRSRTMSVSATSATCQCFGCSLHNALSSPGANAFPLGGHQPPPVGSATPIAHIGGSIAAAGTFSAPDPVAAAAIVLDAQAKREADRTQTAADSGHDSADSRSSSGTGDPMAGPSNNERIITVGDRDLTTEDVNKLGSGRYRIALSASAIERIRRCNAALQELASQDRPIYGINTGFGGLSRIRIEKNQLTQLQINLLRQSAAGVGKPLAHRHVRMMLALRINTMSQGHSGVRIELVQAFIDAFNHDRLPEVPEQGTVGASGDLAPLSHLALGVLGEGRLLPPDPDLVDTSPPQTPTTARPPGFRQQLLTDLGPKEGLALCNGTQLITSLGVEALERTAGLLDQAIIAAAMTTEALFGLNSAFDKELHAVRRHRGQSEVAAQLRRLLPSKSNMSALHDSHSSSDHVQDAYSIRCIPQVYGVILETIDFVRGILNNEINAVTDNPVIFYEDRLAAISGGNFHGEYPAKAIDYLAIACHEIGSMSERRTERLVNESSFKIN